MLCSASEVVISSRELYKKSVNSQQAAGSFTGAHGTCSRGSCFTGLGLSLCGCHYQVFLCRGGGVERDGEMRITKLRHNQMGSQVWGIDWGVFAVEAEE